MTKRNANQQIRRNYIEWCEAKLNPEDVANVKAEIENANNEKKEILGVINKIRESIGQYHARSYLIALIEELNSKAAIISPEQQELIDITNLTAEQVKELLNEELPKGNLKAAKKAELAFEKQHEDGEFMPISKMDSAALLSDESIGSIEPAVRGYFVKNLKLPTPKGFTILKPTEDEREENTQEIPHHKNPSYEEKETDIWIEVPLGSEEDNVIPVPSGYEIVATEDEYGYQVAPPFNGSPLLYFNTDLIENGIAQYIIRRIEKKPDIELENITPSKKEQEYWKKVLPLPEKFYKMDKSKPELIAHAVAAFMRINFRYACNDYLGEFIFDNQDDLSLIMDEMKAGHCDLLSWVQAAYLRSLGLLAVVTTDLATNHGGDAFKKSCGHARVSYVDSEGKIKINDPSQTKYSEIFDKAIATEDVIADMKTKYKYAKTEKKKRNVLREFIKKLKRNLEKEEKKGVEIQIPKLFFMNILEDTIENIEREKKLFRLPPQVELREDLTVKDFIFLASEQCNIEEYDPKTGKYIDEINSELPNIIPFLTNRRIANKKDKNANKISKESKLNLKRFYEYCRAHKFIVVDSLFLEGPFLSRYKNGDEMTEIFYDQVGHGIEFDEELLEIYQTSNSIEELMQRSVLGYINKDYGSYSRKEHPIKSFHDLDEYSPCSLFFVPALIKIVVSPDIKFDEEFKEIIKGLIKKGKFPISIKQIVEKLNSKDKDLLDEDELSRNMLTIFSIHVLFQLIVLAFDNKDLRSRLRNEFNIGAKEIKKFAETVQPVNKDVVKRVTKTPAQLKTPTIGETDFKKFYSILKVIPKDVARARKKIQKLISRLDRSKRKSKGSPRPDHFTLEEYSPFEHDAKYIEWKATARTGKTIVRIPEKLKAHSDPVHVVIDNNYVHKYDASYFSTIEILISELMKIAKRGEGRDIYVCNIEGTHYLKLNPNNKKHNPRAIANLLISHHYSYDDENSLDERGYVELGEEVGNFNTPEGVPKNILFLTPNEGKARAAEFQLRGKSNIVAETFDNAGILIFNEIRDDWMEHEDV